MKEQFSIHGIWPLMTGSCPQMNGLLPKTLKDYSVEMNEVLRDNEQDILYYWPDLNNPTALQFCKRFIFDEWRKHAYGAGMSPTMYVLYGLQLRKAIPYNFGITIGKTIELWEAVDQAKEVMKQLILFGENIGADVYPHLYCYGQNNPNLPLIIHEVRPNS